MRKALRKENRKLWQRALAVIPGGVNSPVRAFTGLPMEPRFIEKAEGAYLWDVEGNRFIDYVCSWGPLILGHAPECVVKAVASAAGKGASFGAPTPAEVELAEIITQTVPSAEKVRLVNSGTEAAMTALRIARGYTGRSAIIKFQGCYHGHSDSLLVQAGSGSATLGVPSSAGVTPETAAQTVSLPYNNLEAVREAVEVRDDIAAIIVEPIAGNMGVVPPGEGFLEGLGELCRERGTVLIFDEVITGFRVAPGGAQELYGLEPDLTTLGKIVGGGMPIGAVAGKAELMDSLAPTGPVYQAGTLSGNPIATAAGLATLKELLSEGIYEKLEKLGSRLEEGLCRALRSKGIPVTVNRVGSMLGVFFTEGPVTNYEEVSACDREMFNRYFSALLANGVYIAPSPFEAMFISAAHTEGDIEETLGVIAEKFEP